MRVSLLRPLSRLTLERDLQVTSPQVTETLSGPADLVFEVAPEMLTRRGEDGHPVLLERGTLVVMERSWGRPVAGLVDQIDPSGERPKISAGGFSMHLTGCPYQGSQLSYIQVDPITVLRALWSHAQAQPAGNLGVGFTGATASAGRLGTPDSAQYLTARQAIAPAEDRVMATRWQLNQLETEATTQFRAIFGLAGIHFIGKVVKRTTPPSSDITKVAWYSTATDVSGGYIYGYDSWKKKWVRSADATDAYHRHLDLLAMLPNAKAWLKEAEANLKAAKQRFSDLKDQAAQPYLINWWTTTDMGTTAEDMLEAGPFEFREVTTWNADDTLTLSLELGAPRVGVRRTDLTFELGVNVIGDPAPIIVDPYTEVLALGSGEGSAQLRSTAAAPAGIQARRVLVVSNKDDRTAARTQARARTTLDKATATAGRVTFEQLTVIDHPNTRLSQFEVGDEIHVTGTLDGLGPIDVWLRILTRTTGDDDTTTTLTTEAS